LEDVEEKLEERAK
jgi:hypothetical protein